MANDGRVLGWLLFPYASALFICESIKKDIHIKCLPLSPLIFGENQVGVYTYVNDIHFPRLLSVYKHSFAFSMHLPSFLQSNNISLLCIPIRINRIHIYRGFMSSGPLLHYVPAHTHTRSQLYKKISILLHFLNFIRTEKLF